MRRKKNQRGPQPVPGMLNRDAIRFSKLYKKERGDGCWIWIGHRDPKGYGQFSLGGKTYWAHRVSYRHFVGQIPDGQEVNHKPCCLNPSCVRPDHLEPMSKSENVGEANGRNVRGAVAASVDQFNCPRCGGVATRTRGTRRQAECWNCGRSFEVKD